MWMETWLAKDFIFFEKYYAHFSSLFIQSYCQTMGWQDSKSLWSTFLLAKHKCVFWKQITLVHLDYAS